MNPLAYLFESLSSINDETELLEACEWDEDRLEYVKDRVNFVFSQSLKDSTIKFSTCDLLEDFSKKLADTINEKELAACLLILERNIKSFLESNKGTEYEN